VYFGPNDAVWPPRVSLSLTLPGWLGMDDDAVRQAVAEELSTAERAARVELEARGGSFLGTRRVTKSSPYKRAKSWEPLRDRNPTFAVGRNQPKAFREAVSALRGFLAAYHNARAQWLEGLRDVVFPHGTWGLQWLHHVTVAPAG
jgi:hypothetical protein